VKFLVTLFRSRRGLAVVAALLLILFVFRPGVYRLRNRISTSIASAIGRRVSIDNVRFHVLPRPGFDLEGLVIYDDPAFSAEPMIRAQDVFAAIRLRSLLYGRLEISALSANEPSINLVRNSAGRWNLATLIERNAQIPAAPTQKAASERRPAFPYLEASNARVNLKIGQEKTPYALVDADVALWQDSENSWGGRIKARPIRADSNLTDTGQVQINATWQRASSMQMTPMHVVAAWQKGQLGQITNLITGADRGWRGDVTISATLDGTPEALSVQSQFAVADFRRYDIVNNRSLRLATHCTAKYDVTTVALTDLNCESPIGEGIVRTTGTVGAATKPLTYDLKIAAEKVPAASVVNVLHQAKQHLPADLDADGLLNADFRARRTAGMTAQWSGSGAATQVRLRSSNGKDSISIGNIPLTLIADANCCRPDGSPLSTRGKPISNSIDPEPSETHLRIGPASMAVNTSAPVTVGGWISLSGYRFSLRGDLDLKNLSRVENAFAVPAARPAVEGTASLDLSISGSWHGLAAPNSLGSAELRNVRAEILGVNAPVEISSATVILGPDNAAVQKLSARLGNSRWTGWVRAPRHCAPSCLYQFDLTADKVSSADLVEWLAAQPAKHPWYRILSSAPEGPSPLLALRAHGMLRVNQFVMKKAAASQLATELTADRGEITLAHLRGQFLQGTHQGTWTIDASVRPMRVKGNGALQNVSLQQVSSLMNDGWVSGTGDGNFELTTAGARFSDMLANSEAKMQFVVRNGSLTHIAIPGAPVPLPIHRFSGSLELNKGKWLLSGGRLESRDGLYQVSGTSSEAGSLDFVFTRGDEQSWNLTGTIAKPHAAPTNRTEAEAISGVQP
jgi:AsmA family